MFRLNLIIEAPNDPSPHEILVDRFPFQLGRALENDLSLPFASISSRHLTIDRQGGQQILLTDLGSTNGTKIDDQPLKPHQARSVFLPCTLRLGDIHISLEATDPDEIAFTLAQSGTELREMVDDVVRQSEIDEESDPFFEILSGPGSGRRFYLRLDGGPTILGTGGEAHIRLDLPNLPDVLASVDWDQSRCCLTPRSDLINHQGRPLSQEHPLRSGDRFIIDAMELLYFDPLEKALASMECSASEMHPPDLDEEPIEESAPAEEPSGDPDKIEDAEDEPEAVKPPTEKINTPNRASSQPRLGLTEIALLVMSVVFLIGTIGLLWLLL